MKNIDVIGKIVDTQGTYDDEGNELTAPTYLTGWHVNTTSEVPEWADYLCDPQPVTPVRIYAGGVHPGEEGSSIASSAVSRVASSGNL